MWKQENTTYTTGPLASNPSLSSPTPGSVLSSSSATFSWSANGSTITAPVSTATPIQSGRVVDALFVAIRKAGHQPSVLAFKRKAPIRLGEAEGVRLALVLLTTQPIAKHERVRALVAGINAMSVEETYYWYSKCMGLDGNRGRKALRTLLAN